MTNRPLKSIACVLMLSLILPLSANADIINIVNMRPDRTTVSGFTGTSNTSGNGNTVTYSLSQTGDLDSGTVDDTLSFDLIYEAYTGSTFAAGDVTLGTRSAPSTSGQNWHSNAFEVGETVSFSIANIVYTDGEGDDTAVFNGFTAIRPTSFPSTPAGNIDYYVGLTGASTVTIDPTGNVGFGGSTSAFITAASGPVRLRQLSFQFETVPTAVPEPSSLALLASGLGLIGLRRRRLK